MFFLDAFVNKIEDLSDFLKIISKRCVNDCYGTDPSEHANILLQVIVKMEIEMDLI